MYVYIYIHIHPDIYLCKYICIYINNELTNLKVMHDSGIHVLKKNLAILVNIQSNNICALDQQRMDLQGFPMVSHCDTIPRPRSVAFLGTARRERRRWRRSRVSVVLFEPLDERQVESHHDCGCHDKI